MPLEPTDIAYFRKFLYERSAAPGLIDDALMKSVRLIERAADCKFDLKPAEMFRIHPKVQERLEEAIRLATGAEVRAIAYAPLAMPAAAGWDWLAPDAYPGALHAGLMGTLGKRLEDFLRESRGGHDGLAEDLWTEILGLTGLGTIDHLVGHASGTYLAILDEYLGAAVRNDAARKDGFEALIDALNYCVPLGTKDRDPGTWIVLTG